MLEGGVEAEIVMNEEEVAREVQLEYLQEDILVIILDPAHLLLCPVNNDLQVGVAHLR